MITELKDLIQKLANWIEIAIPQARTLTKDAEGRDWFLRSVGYDKKLILEDLRNFTDRSNLNKQYDDRFKDTNLKSRKGISALKVEISALYSFNKCFVQRYKGRMHYYRDDLSQKGARTMCAAGQAMGLFSEFKKNLDA
jgi:hypothetical protein